MKRSRIALGQRRNRRMKNAGAEAAQFRGRAFLALVCILGALLGLGGWYFRLQVLQHDDFVTRSEANRIKLQPIVPGRGLIYDRKGRILADNVPAWRLDVTPSEAGDSAKWLPGIAKIIELAPEDVERFDDARRGSRGFKPITLKMRLSDEEAARFAVDRWRYPGIELVSYLNRRYPYGELTAHVIGYVGRVDEADAKNLGPGFDALTHIGKTGLERAYEDQLRGHIGYEKIETNVEGRPLRTVGRVPAQPGTDLRLSIDIDLQQAMVTAFGDMDGAAVAVDPQTGDVLAMVSLPSYDANLFVNGITHKAYKSLTTNPSRPLFNRPVLGGGPPGSTIKPLFGLAGLDSGLRTPETAVFSTGEFHIPGQKRGYRDAHGAAGWTDLKKSIAQSVNFYYYKLAFDMGIDKFDAYMRKFGFGQKSGIDLLGENVGIVPSPGWKAKRSKDPWYAGETVIAGIGQGYWVATVLQLARGTAAIANGGALNPLHLVMSTRDGYNGPWRATPHPPGARITESEQHLHAVQDGMVATVHGGGTAANIARGATYLMAGKTGTAQKVGRQAGRNVDPHALPYNLRHQALFVAYAPADNPRIAIAVSVEHGGFGASSAAPIARKVFDAWLIGKMPEPEEGVARSPQGGAPLDYVPPTEIPTPAPPPKPGTPPAAVPEPDDEEPAPASPEPLPTAKPVAVARGEAASRRALAVLKSLQGGAR
ncbi:penicillin-binding protein 2 [Lysobacter claricitrinus]|uniref:penicillin-binding protein 2 n=1 Tax=Lysobacter claricitrinus TaxID=3367728 RepID=UPI0037DBB88F